MDAPSDGLMGCDLKVMLPQGRPVQGCEGPLMESIFVLQHPWELWREARQMTGRI